jgi:hypothetical protein
MESRRSYWFEPHRGSRCNENGHKFVAHKLIEESAGRPQDSQQLKNLDAGSEDLLPLSEQSLTRRNIVRIRSETVTKHFVRECNEI